MRTERVTRSHDRYEPGPYMEDTVAMSGRRLGRSGCVGGGGEAVDVVAVGALVSSDRAGDGSWKSRRNTIVRHTDMMLCRSGKC